jgi:hypothetical protein
MMRRTNLLKQECKPIVECRARNFPFILLIAPAQAKSPVTRSRAGCHRRSQGAHIYVFPTPKSFEVDGKWSLVVPRGFDDIPWPGKFQGRFRTLRPIRELATFRTGGLSKRLPQLQRTCQSLPTVPGHTLPSMRDALACQDAQSWAAALSPVQCLTPSVSLR